MRWAMPKRTSIPKTTIEVTPTRMASIAKRDTVKGKLSTSERIVLGTHVARVDEVLPLFRGLSEEPREPLLESDSDVSRCTTTPLWPLRAFGIAVATSAVTSSASFVVFLTKLTIGEK